jgi:hypothetical protein
MATRPSNLIVMMSFLNSSSLVMPGLDPGIHQNRRSWLIDQRWIAGSSPAMTSDVYAK